MTYRISGLRVRPRYWVGLGTAVLIVSTTSCTLAPRGDMAASERLRETAGLVEEVKAFGKTLGVEPTSTLSRTTQEAPALSMLWLWMQRAGTLALRAPVDIRMAIGFNSEKERLKIEQVYRVDGYSVYYRQGNEFADSRSVATIGFAAEPIVRRVMVILHEDLHGDANFALPWEIEEAIVTPLGWLAAVEYFRQKGENTNWKNAVASVAEERKLSRELITFAADAEQMFGTLPVDDAKEKILDRLAQYPTYRRQFDRQIHGQHAPTALEAKLSHDLAYYRYFDRITDLAEKASSLKTLIADLKNIPTETNPAATEKFLQALFTNYSTAAR